MTSQAAASLAPPRTTITTEETCVLATLRDRYQEDRGLFSLRELVHLRFLRWLVQTGRLSP
jgi:hypothetical protein